MDKRSTLGLLALLLLVGLLRFSGAAATAPTASAAATESAVTTASTAGAANSPVKHIFVVFQENRSFDNYFGVYPNAEGFIPLPGTPDENGIPADSFNLDAAGKKVAP
ncbi:MAG: Phosphoesterase family, partial [Paenibacillaceae bacterium]|nr:Phosphoesterase family [Paenibacillaceae bacterium]